MQLPLRTVAVTAILAFAAGLAVASFATFRSFLPGLLQGALTTVEITLGGCALAVVAAVSAALLKMYGPWPLRWLAIVYVEIFRGTSALVQLFWLFFVLPHFGVTLAPLTAPWRPKRTAARAHGGPIAAETDGLLAPLTASWRR